MKGVYGDDVSLAREESKLLLRGRSVLALKSPTEHWSIKLEYNMESFKWEKTPGSSPAAL